MARSERILHLSAEAMGHYIGTAGWSLPKELRGKFPKEGSLLERYSQRFNCVEINSSFYRDHSASTYSRWAQSVPDRFRFSIKLSQQFSHAQKLKVKSQDLKRKLSDILQLGDKLGCLLVQLPPSLEFDQKSSSRFFQSLRQIYSGPIALEPRNISWASHGAWRVLETNKVSPVIADPSALSHMGDLSRFQFVYYRLHGAPIRYRSEYSQDALKAYSKQIKAFTKERKNVWCIFDNTMFGHAARNGLDLMGILQP